MRKFIRGMTALIGCGIAVLWGLMIHFESSMPEQFSVTEGKELTLNGVVEVVQRPAFHLIQPTAGVSPDTTKRSTLSLFGVFPIKTVTVKQVTAPVAVAAVVAGAVVGTMDMIKGPIKRQMRSTKSHQASQTQHPRATAFHRSPRERTIVLAAASPWTAELWTTICPH